MGLFVSIFSAFRIGIDDFQRKILESPSPPGESTFIDIMRHPASASLPTVSAAAIVGALYGTRGGPSNPETNCALEAPAL